MRIADAYGDELIHEGRELARAIATWKALLSDQAKIDAAFTMYDQDNSGSPDPAQAARFFST